MHPVLTMLHREWLENPLVSRVPFFLLACITLLFISIMVNFDFEHYSIFQISTQENDQEIQKKLGDELSTLIAGGSGLLSILLGTLYFPRTLRKERSEGSIMFWRSMPVSDTQTHLVKLAFSLLVIPLVCSSLVIISDLMLWTLNILTDHQIGFLSRYSSMVYVLMHWVEFLMRMGLAALFLLPVGLTMMAISQKLSSPLVILALAIYALRWMPIALFGYYGVDEFVSKMFYLPFHAIIGQKPLDALIEAGSTYIGIYALIGLLAWTINLRFSRTIK